MQLSDKLQYIPLDKQLQSQISCTLPHLKSLQPLKEAATLTHMPRRRSSCELQPSDRQINNLGGSKTEL